VADCGSHNVTTYIKEKKRKEIKKKISEKENSRNITK